MASPGDKRGSSQETEVERYQPLTSLRYPTEHDNTVVQLDVGVRIKVRYLDKRGSAESDSTRDKRDQETYDDSKTRVYGEMKKDQLLRKLFDDYQAGLLKDANSDSLDPGEILVRLDSAQDEEERSLICEAELTQFTGEQRDRLLPVLWQFIIERRDSNIYADLIAVGSAIRKYVAMMDVTQIGNLSTLLESSHRVALPPDLVLEVAKMVYRKFEANPPAQRDPEPVVARQLAEIARLYLNPRLFPYALHATTAMVSTQVLAVMLSQEWSGVISQLNASPYGWFRVQLRRRLLSSLGSWRARNVPMADSLSQLLSEISTE